MRLRPDLLTLMIVLPLSLPAEEPGVPPPEKPVGADGATATLHLLPPTPPEAPATEPAPAAETPAPVPAPQVAPQAEEAKRPAKAGKKDPETEAQRTERAAAEQEKAERAAIEETQKKIARLNLERDLLQAENALRAEKLKQELGEMTDERERLNARFLLERDRLANSLARQRLEAERWALESDLITKQLAREETQIRLDTARASSDLKKEEALLKAQNTLSTEKLTLAGNTLRARENEIKQARLESDAEISRMESRIRAFDRQELALSLAPRERISYDEKPFDGRRLVISDRRIELNGPITYHTGDHVSQRIHYYNNLNPGPPIFLVIDSSPGGSVMAGFQILKAMESSRSPVHVVVKTFAASMAACITTLAEESYAYPDAVLLHHQISYGMLGNLRQQQEELEQGKEWFTRLGGPVAKKMGITLEDFVKRMYEKNSTGDWQEFADKARNLKWVNHIAEEIVETSRLKNPDLRYNLQPAPMVPMVAEVEASSGADREEVDAKGRRFQRLPRLQPFDCYHLYDPHQYFRME
jgi:ATP-dependent Clp protease protease subunit